MILDALMLARLPLMKDTQSFLLDHWHLDISIRKVESGAH
jgi:hypothetical protein